MDAPKSVTSFGGKYTHDDDWEFLDNQEITYQFDDNKLITYKGHSRGKIVASENPEAIVYGSNGAIVFGQTDYTIHDLDGKPIGGEKKIVEGDSSDTVGGGANVALHIANFFDGIRKGQKLNSPIADGAISTMLCHLGNPSTSKIMNDAEAMSYWKRNYADGWEPKL